MIRLIRWLMGYVEFAFTNGFADGFVNDCFQQKINIHNIKRDDNAVTGICLAGEYKRLRAVAKSNGGAVRIIKKRGVRFPAIKAMSRTGIVAGILAFILIFNSLSGFVWRIDITGNKELKTSELMDCLNENGLYVGAKWSDISPRLIENYIMMSYEKCAWIHINRSGSRATVEIDEAVLQPTLDSDKGRANLKAKKDGVVTYTNIKRGWDIVKVGSAVTKGDLLASGVYESELNKTNHFTHASGVVIARVVEPFEITISRTQAQKLYTEEKSRKTLFFFGLQIPLYFGKAPTQDCDITEERKFIRLNDFDLPIGIIKREYKSYISSERELSDRELTALTSKEIDKRLKTDYHDAEILNKEIEIEITANFAKARGSVTVLEDIAEEVYF